jgi:hypothetical protein
MGDRDAPILSAFFQAREDPGISPGAALQLGNFLPGILTAIPVTVPFLLI